MSVIYLFVTKKEDIVTLAPPGIKDIACIFH